VSRKIAFEFADDTGHGVGHEWGAPVGVVAVDGGDQPGPGGLNKILGRGPAAVAKPAGQPVGQTQVCQDDALAQLEIMAGGVFLQPLLDFGRGLLDAGTDLDAGMVKRRCDGSGYPGTSVDWSSTRARWTDSISSKHQRPPLRRFFANLITWPSSWRLARPTVPATWRPP
jgi:hypothetical protein